MDSVDIRTATADDYDRIASVVNDWWGRDVLSGLPRLFLQHFHATSLIAEDPQLVGFLVGFVSPGQPDEAYVHYVGVHPQHRQHGLARRLYQHFTSEASDAGCSRVRAITSPTNLGSIAFHRRMGFDVSEPVSGYNGPGSEMVTFSRFLQ